MAEKKRYVEAADFVRALTIASVVAVHSTWYMANGGGWVASGAILSILHFTRESFMALTGFVLTFSLFGKQLKWKEVWIKRYKLVLFPYMIWSAGYMLLFGTFAGVGVFFLTYGKNLLDGGAWFHLYYLLITMQFYLVLPLFLALMRVAKKHPVWVFLGALTFQMALMAYDQYGIGPHPTFFLNQYTGDEVWTYTLFFVVGGIAALHWPAIREWLRTHLGLVIWVSAGTAALMLAEFFLETYLGGNMTLGDSVLQPAMVPWAVMSIVLLAAIGVRYEAARAITPGRWPLVKWLADLSFGIYLCHPMLLQLWTNLLSQFHLDQASYWLDALTVALLLAVSTIAMWLISKTPISSWLIGRAKVHLTVVVRQPEGSAVSSRLQQS